MDVPQFDGLLCDLGALHEDAVEELLHEHAALPPTGAGVEPEVLQEEPSQHESDDHQDQE